MRVYLILLVFFAVVTSGFSQAGGFTNAGQDVFRWDADSAGGSGSIITMLEPAGSKTIGSKGNPVCVFTSSGGSLVNTNPAFIAGTIASYTFEGMFRPAQSDPSAANYVLEVGTGTEGNLTLSVNKAELILDISGGSSITGWPAGGIVYGVPTNLQSDGFIHVAFTRKIVGTQSVLTLYYNGGVAGSASVPLSFAPNFSFDYDLAEGTSGDSYLGEVDNIRIWQAAGSNNGARADDQIRAYAFAELAGYPLAVSNLSVSYVFGSGESYTLTSGASIGGEVYAYNHNSAADGHYYIESAEKGVAGFSVSHADGTAGTLADSYINRVIYTVFETPVNAELLSPQVLYQEGNVYNYTTNTLSGSGYVLSMNNGYLTLSYHSSGSTVASVTYVNGGGYPIGLSASTRYMVEARITGNGVTGGTKIALYINGIFAGESSAFSGTVNLATTGTEVALGASMNGTVLPLVTPGQPSADYIYYLRSSIFRGRLYEYVVRSGENVTDQVITTNFLSTNYGVGIATSGSGNVIDYFNENGTYVYQAAGLGYTGTGDNQLTSNSDIRVAANPDFTYGPVYVLWAHNSLSDGVYDIGYNSNTQNAPLNVKLQQREWLVQGPTGSTYENYVAQISVPAGKYPSIAYGQELVAVIDSDRDGNYRTGSYVVVLKLNTGGTAYEGHAPFQNIHEPTYIHFKMRIGFLNQYEYTTAFPSRLTAIGEGNNYDRPVYSDASGILTLDNESGLKNGDYILAQDNNAALAFNGTLVVNDNAGTATTIKVTDRIWKFNVYGTPGPVNIAFLAGSLPALPSGTDHYVLIVDADGVFDAASSKVYVLSDIASYKKAFFQALSDGYYMKLGAVQQNHLQSTVSPNQVIMNPVVSGSGLNLTVADQYSFNVSGGCVQTMSKSVLKVNYSTGDMHISGDLAFTSSTTVTVTGYSDYGMTTSLFSYSTTLALDELDPERTWSLDVAGYYPMLKKVSVSVSGYSASAQPVINSQLRLKLSLEETPQIQVPVTSTSVIRNMDVSRASIDAASAFIFSWVSDACACNTYQLQLLRLYNQKDVYSTLPGQENRSALDETSIQSSVDWSKALQIEVPQPHVQLLLTEGTGFYVWRVRPVGNYYSGGVSDSRNWGNWSTDNYSIAATGAYSVSALSANSHGVQTANSNTVLWYDQFERDKNFAYQRTFTEDGKVHEGITYASGLLQEKQSIVRMNGNGTEGSGTDQELIVSQSVYDFAGRGALNSLPAPVSNDNDMGYQEQFLMNTGNLYTPFNFDTDAKRQHPDAINGGVMQNYYSDANPDPSVPAADGFGFSRTLFDNDGTNAVVEQGGVGPVHALKPSQAEAHTVRIMESGVSDEELILVFGDEAPAAGSVFKTATTDQNNVTSITYTDKEGQVIATCLANRKITNADGSSVPYYTDALDSEGDPSTTFDVETAINDNIPYGDNGLQASRTFGFVKQTVVTISYKITPSLIQNMCGTYCASCGYKLKVDVVNLDNPGVNEVHDTISIPMVFQNNNCTASEQTPFDFPDITLEPGRYAISRTIVPDMDAANDFAADITNAENTKITTLTQPLVDLLSSADVGLSAAQAAYGSLINGAFSSSTYDIVLYDRQENQLASSVGVTSGSVDAATLQSGYHFVLSTTCCSIDIPVQLPEYNPCDDNTIVTGSTTKTVTNPIGLSHAMIDVLAQAQNVTVGSGFDYDGFVVTSGASPSIRNWSGADLTTLLTNMTTNSTMGYTMSQSECRQLWSCWNASASSIAGGANGTGVPDDPHNTDAAVAQAYKDNAPSDGTTISTMGTNFTASRPDMIESTLDCYGRDYVGFTTDYATYKANAFRTFYRDPATLITGGHYCDKMFCLSNNISDPIEPPTDEHIQQVYCSDISDCVISYGTLLHPDANALIQQDHVLNPLAVPAITDNVIDDNANNLALKGCLSGYASMPTGFDPNTAFSFPKTLADAQVHQGEFEDMCRQQCDLRDGEFLSAMRAVYDPTGTNDYKYYSTGVELAVNGNFDTNLNGWYSAAAWNTTATAFTSSDVSVNGQYTSTKAGLTNYGIKTGDVLTAGTSYRLFFELNNYVEYPLGTKVFVMNNSQLLYTITDTKNYVESIVFTAVTGGASSIGFYTELPFNYCSPCTDGYSSAPNFYVDNVSLREVILEDGLEPEDVCCMAQSITDYCKQQCHLDIVTEDCNGDGTADKVVRVGTDEQVRIFSAIMYGKFELGETSTIGGVPDQCGDGWNKIVPDIDLTTPAACLNGVPNKLWDKSYAGNNQVICIGKDDDNNVYVLDDKGTFTKINPNTGALIWQSAASTSSVDGPYITNSFNKFICLGNEEFIFAGMSSLNDGDILISRQKYIGTALTDAYAAGFTRPYGGNSDESFTDIIQTGNTFAIAGTSPSAPDPTDQSLDTVHGSRKTSPNYGSDDYWFFKMDALGNVLPGTQMSFGGPGPDGCRFFKPDNAGNFYLIGSSASGTATPSNKTANSIPDNDAYWVVKIKADLTVTQLQHEAFVPAMFFYLDYDLVIPTEDNYVYTYENGSPNYGSCYLRKYLGDDLVWDNKLVFDAGSSGGINTKQIYTASDNGFYILGDVQGAAGTHDPAFGIADYFLIKTDKDGNYEWDRSFGGNNQDFIDYRHGNKTNLLEVNGSLILGGLSASQPYSVTGIGNRTAPFLGGDLDDWVVGVRLGTNTSCVPKDICIKWIPVYEHDYTVGDYWPELPPPLPPPPIPPRPGRTPWQDVSVSIPFLIGQCSSAQYNDLVTAYVNACMHGTINDLLKVKYNEGFHHYTLYYYDRAGNLVRTVPPMGVKPLDLSQTNVMNRQVHPAHTLVTSYEYNSIGQLVNQSTPDGGITNLIYNSIGQLRFSQNARQAGNNTCSYTKYDELGRILEVGECSLATAGVAFSALTPYADANGAFTAFGSKSFPTLGNGQQTVTVYTDAATQASYLDQGQSYLRNRVSYVYTYALNGERAVSYYSYDPHGNVSWLMQEIPGQSRNTISYDYDLISNKVLCAKYNEGQPDAFFHKYSYDTDDRVTAVYTSRDRVLWDKDAGYTYYKHGALRRTELGEDAIQGIDHTYTIQGWLKALNNPSLGVGSDAGNDGGTGSSFAADEYGMALNYYKGDFTRTASNIYNPVPGSSGTAGTYAFIADNNRQLFNGNISSWVSRVEQEHRDYISAGNTDNTVNSDKFTTANYYTYDDLNRITTSAFSEFSSTGAASANGDTYSRLTATGKFGTAYSYDANGNIKTLKRYSVDGTGASQLMDNLSYSYTGASAGAGATGSNNQLTAIQDAIGAGDFDDDVDNYSGTRYSYDAIGNLVQDAAEGINITWTVYGKVSEVKRISATSTTKPEVRYTYDAMGQRIKKEVNMTPYDGSGNPQRLPDQILTTFYVRDASGNVMSIYKRKNTAVSGQPGYYAAEYDQTEIPIYGSARVGIYEPDATDMVVAGKKFQTSDLDHMLYDRTASNKSNYDGYWNVATRENTTINNTSSVPVSIAATGLWNTTNSGDASTSVYTFGKSKAYAFSGKAGNAVAHGLNANGQVQFTAFTAFDYFGTANKLMILSGANGVMMKGAESLTADPRAQIAITQVPGSTSRYYLITATGGNLIYYLIDMSLPGYGTSGAPMGEVIPPGYAGANTFAATGASGVYGKSLLVRENKSGSSTLLYATRYVAPVLPADTYGHIELLAFTLPSAQDLTRNGDAMLNITAEVMCRPSGLLSTDVLYNSATGAYASLVEEQGELAFNAKGDELLYYLQGQRQGWFSHQSSQVLSYTIGYDGKIAKNAIVAKYTVPVTDPSLPGSSVAVSSDGRFVYYSKDQLYATNGSAAHIWRYDLRNGTNAEVSGVNIAGDLRNLYSGLLIEVADNKSLTALSLQETDLGATQSGLNNVTFSTLTGKIGHWPLQNFRIYAAATGTTVSVRKISRKRYELTDHLGNVTVVVTDRKCATYISSVLATKAKVASYTNYYAFGMGIKSRSGDVVEGYRYGFNGKEQAKEIDDYDYDFGARIYDAKICRWLSVDPLFNKYPMDAPYIYAGNNSVVIIDIAGEEKIVISGSENGKRSRTHFIVTAMKWILKNKSVSEQTAWLVFSHNYTDKQKGKIASFASKNHVNLMWVNSADEVISYINTHNACATSTAVTNYRKNDPITDMAIFSHGTPGYIDFGHDIPEVQAKYLFSKAHASQLSPEAFALDKSTIYLYTCRGGAGIDVELDGGIGLNDWDTKPELSIAQELANTTGASVWALQKRIDYENVLGNRKLLFIKDKLGTSTNRNDQGDDWDKNLDEIEMPSSGSSPHSPGWTKFKKGEKPETQSIFHEAPLGIH